MKVLILVAIFIFANFISLSNSARCPCLCCLKEGSNVDCPEVLVGNVNIDSCSDDVTICKARCEAQFPTECGANNSLVDSNCVSDDPTTPYPTTVTTAYNGQVQCKCECCTGPSCSLTVQGNVIVDKCTECASGCAQKYPSTCGPPATVAAATCEPAPPSSTTSRLNFNIFLFLLFIFSKVLFL
jgi:hypothetical protein